MVLNEVYSVMATDALSTSHPLSFREDEINTPAQISEVFDSIAYSKVGARGPGAGAPGRWGGVGCGVPRAPRVSHPPSPQGASVLRMLSDFLTEDVFKEGLQVRLCGCRGAPSPGAGWAAHGKGLLGGSVGVLHPGPAPPPAHPSLLVLSRRPTSTNLPMETPSTRTSGFICKR